MKTRAEYQREYRERKKQNDSTFLARERNRVKGYRKELQSLTKKEQRRVRARNKIYSQTYRERQIKQKAALKHGDGIMSEDPGEQSNVVSSSTEARDMTTCDTKHTATPLVVRMEFPTKRNNRRRSLALRRAHENVIKMRQEILKYKRANWRLQKRNKKLKTSLPGPRTTSKADEVSVISTDPTSNQHDTESTPSTRARQDLRQSGFSPSKIPANVIKRLTMANVLLDEVKHTRQLNPKEKSMKALASVVSGKVIKKYRCISRLSTASGFSKRQLRCVQSKVLNLKGRARLTLVKEALRHRVITFLERDDISVTMPGKNDGKRCEGVVRQTRVLNDYLSNIFEKFKAENADIKMAFSSFCKMRPRYILLTSFISRNTCLCSRHQNMAMKLKCLRSLGLNNITKSPEMVSSQLSQEDMVDLLKTITAQNVEFEKWSRVEVEGKQRMRVIKVTMDVNDFVEVMKTEYSDFLNHVARVKAQYRALHTLKDTLPVNHIILQMDFAENFSCGNMDEIQSAYWNCTNVTLHPVVAYYNSDDGKLEHKNFVFVSDVNKHNSTAVITILKKLVKELLEIFPAVEYIHYWTDSPSSQYRNKYIFDVVLHHTELFGIKGRWNYFESGHGKGPCDGLGGSSKRQACDAVKQGKATIQDAHDYYKWARTCQKSINYRFYSSDDLDITTQDLDRSSAKVVTGTMKIHAVFQKEGILYSRDVSCYCLGCLQENNLCPDWQQHQLTAVANHNVPVNDPSLTSIASVFVPTVDKFVTAMYDGHWYIGQILEVDMVDGDAKISFMEKSRGKGKNPTFRWPARPDELWLKFNDILWHIDDPVPVGKTKRQYTISSEYLERLDMIKP